MINVTRMNDTSYTLNAELIEMIEETPDTVITLVSGKKFIVKESREQIIRLVEEYKRHIFIR
jgi:flagellar protein FlbD